MNTFFFDSYDFNNVTNVASFSYRLGSKHAFTEKVTFQRQQTDYDSGALQKALFLAFLLIGTSYYKTFPTSQVEVLAGSIDKWQAAFLNKVYQEGLSQFAFENRLTREDLAHFDATSEFSQTAHDYNGEGILALQSGGKDSLLIASLLREKNINFSSLYISSSGQYPKVIDAIGQPVRLIQRDIDREGLRRAAEQGGKNGHVPVTYIVLAISLVQVVLDGKNTVIAAIGHEGEEPHAMISDLPVNHQWSKTWQAEQLFAEYVRRYVSPNIQVGSPLRQYSELRIADLFVQKSWKKYGQRFSSCNIANYGQGINNEQLSWCGECPKCANSYLLFAPFLEPNELKSLFGNKDLFASKDLAETFKGLLGVDGVMKPFECVGEVDELRAAYHRALNNGYAALPFDVPVSGFDYTQTYDAQEMLLPVLNS